MNFNKIFSTSDHLIDCELYDNLSHREQTRTALGAEFCNFMDEIGGTGKEIQARGSEYYKTEQAYSQLIKKKEILKYLVFSLTDNELEERLACLKFLLMFSKALPEIYLKVLGDDAPEEQKKFFSELIENDGDNLSTLLLTEITKEYLYLITAGREIVKAVEHMNTIVAKQNRSKQDRTDPFVEKARDRAKQIWQAHRKQSLSDTAYQIKQELDLRKSSSTIQEWIRDLNPNSKKKSK